ncbi:MAG: hypothetical protein JSS51_05285 [Planctomycetes bacterium]|nr:hypothetical protein [Planctomycetota bacterium]
MRTAFPDCRFLAILNMSIALVLPSANARADHSLPFNDTNFANADWFLQNFGNRNATATQVPDGFSGTGRQVTHPLSLNSSVQACHLLNVPTAQIDPASGTVVSLDFSIMAKFINGVGANGHQVGLALFQDEILYRAGALVTGTSGEWVHLTLTSLKSSDFTRFDGQPGNPDFSPAGQPIMFGFRTGNGNAGQNVNQVVVYDDFSVVVHRSTILVVDGSPANSDWTETIATTGTGGSFSSIGSQPNGNPDTCQLVTFTINAGSSSVEVLDLYNADKGYIQPAYGAIETIDFATDFRLNTNGSSSPVTTNLLLSQASVLYQGPNMSSGTGTNWHPVEARSLRASDFKRHDGQPGLPDFSTNGAPIRVGRRLQASHGAAGSLTTLKQYLDNFTVRAHFVDCRCDLNLDGFVDDADFTFFLMGYNILDCADPAMFPGCPPDFNDDGFVDDGDFLMFVAAYDALECP